MRIVKTNVRMWKVSKKYYLYKVILLCRGKDKWYSDAACCMWKNFFFPFFLKVSMLPCERPLLYFTRPGEIRSPSRFGWNQDGDCISPGRVPCDTSLSRECLLNLTVKLWKMFFRMQRTASHGLNLWTRTPTQEAQPPQYANSDNEYGDGLTTTDESFLFHLFSWNKTNKSRAHTSGMDESPSAYVMQ